MKRQRATPVVKDNTAWKAFFTVPFFLGLVLIVFEINIYRVTVIDSSILLYIIAVIGIITHFLTHKKYLEVYPEKGNLFYSLLSSTVSWGFTACYLFMALNYYALESRVRYYSFNIKEKSSMPGGKGHRDERQPLVRFDYLGEEKELVFGYSETEEVKQAKTVVISMKEGFLGYDVICSRNLVK